MTFQRFMDQIFKSLGFLFIYIRTSKSNKEHIIHLRVVLIRLKLAGLVYNLPKCTLATLPWTSLATWSAHRASPLWPPGWRPSAATPQHHQGALAVPDFSTSTKSSWPCAGPPQRGPERLASGTRIQWLADILTAFNLAKNSLSTTAELSHPSLPAKLALVANARTTHVGAALHQQHHPGGPWEPLGFFSKKMDSAQVSYSTFYRELLAAFSAVWHFRFQ